MKKVSENLKRGRPTSWTDEELMKLALETKYKHHGKKLTPSFLEQETQVGRNTWSRRMKVYIDDLNKPTFSKPDLDDTNEALMPSVDLIFKKHGNNKLALKNELLDLEILLYDFYKELQVYKEKEKRLEEELSQIQLLKEEAVRQRERAEHL